MISEAQKQYYKDMLEKRRLFPYYIGNRLAAIITYYIGTLDDPKYTDRDHWNIVDDDRNGDMCYIDQLVTDRHADNPREALLCWHIFKRHIKLEYPNVETIKWSHYKNGGGLHVHYTNIK